MCDGNKFANKYQKVLVGTQALMALRTPSIFIFSH